MKTQLRFLGFLLAIMSLVALMVPGCGSDDDNITSGGNDTTPVDTGGTLLNIDSMIQFANDSLGRQLNFMINITLDNPDTTFRPRDLDFTGLNGLYQQILNVAPTNPDAKFGVAFTNLMIFLVDPILNDLIDRFKYVVDTSSFGSPSWVPEIIIGGELMPSGIPLTTSRFSSIFPDLTRLDHSIRMSASGDPVVSEVQTLLETSFLPRIDAAILHLADIINSANYTFTITPAMQGNLGANPIEVDRADFRVFLAVGHAVKAAIHVFSARNLNLASYDVAGVNAALQPGNPFLDLRAGGHMPLAKTSLLTGVSAARAALVELQAEAISGEDQANDLIKVYPDDVDELQEAIDSIDYYVTYFNGQKQLDIIWTRDYPTKDTISAMVDISKFFDDPMDNPKNFIPAYTVSLTELPDNLAELFADAHFSQVRLDNAFTALYGVGTSDPSHVDSINKYSWWNEYSPLPATNTPQFYSLLGTRWSAYELGWDDFITHCSPGDGNLGCYSSERQNWYHNNYAGDKFVETCVGWQASTYAEWTFPHPTFNELLPGTTSDDIKGWIYETPPSSWEQSHCDTIRL